MPGVETNMKYVLNCKGIRPIVETFQLNMRSEHNQFSNCYPRHSIGWFFVAFLRVWALLVLGFGAQCMYSLPLDCKRKTVNASPKGLWAKHCKFRPEGSERILWKERGGSLLLQECCWDEKNHETPQPPGLVGFLQVTGSSPQKCSHTN